MKKASLTVTCLFLFAATLWATDAFSARSKLMLDHRDRNAGNPSATKTDLCKAFVAVQGSEVIDALCDFVQQRFIRPRVTVAIQAGGESKRMGQSKATVPFGGRPLIMRMVERVAAVADEILITTNEPENLQFLFDEYPGLSLRMERDKLDFRGALPGFLTAFETASTPYIAMVACDMVFASAKLIAAECAELSLSQADCVVPVNKHGFEPFHAVYMREACLPAIRAHVNKGEMRAQAFLSDVTVCEFPQARVLSVEPMGGCFINVNTPEELTAIEERYI